MKNFVYDKNAGLSNEEISTFPSHGKIKNQSKKYVIKSQYIIYPGKDTPSCESKNIDSLKVEK